MKEKARELTPGPSTTNEVQGNWTGAPCSPERTPGFPVEFPGVDELHAAFLNESRTRICWWRPVQEIRDHGPKKLGAALRMLLLNP